MSDSYDSFEQQRNRRSRIQTLKTRIMTFIVLWMVMMALVMGFLCYKVFSLQRQINAILTNSGEPVAVNNTVTGTGGYNEEGIINSFGDTAKDNIALPEDTLKVYLTFDDGPSANTNKILDILDDYNVKATFFVVGREDEESLAVYKRIVDEGHTLGMHSYTHNYSEVYASVDSFSSDLERLRNLLYSTTGEDCKFFRFPGGSSNQVSNLGMASFIRYLNDQGLTYVDWNVQSGDATTQVYTADDIVENVLSGVIKYKTSIVLMHDAEAKQTTVDALPAMIEQLQAKGVLFSGIDEDTTVIQHVTLQD